MTTTKSPYLKPREAAEYCRYSYDHFRDLQARGKTPALRSGRGLRHILYAPAALDRWLSAGGGRAVA